MIDIKEITSLISALRLEIEADSISPERLGYILQRMLNLTGASYSAEEMDNLLKLLEDRGKSNLDAVINDYRNRITNLKSYTDGRFEENNEYLKQVKTILEIIYDTNPDVWPEIGDMLEQMGRNLHMEIDCDGGDNVVGYGETKHISCRIFNGYNKDVTDSIVKWSIVRDSGPGTTEDIDNGDEEWNRYKAKVRNFKGEIDLLFVQGDDVDGLPLDDFGYVRNPNLNKVVFTITAYTAEDEVKAQLVI